MAANGDQGIGDGQKALYDRQIHALGMKTMQSLAKARVLIVGMRGLGVEIAKNVILAGPSVVTLADSAPVDRLDLAAQFYLSEADVGSNRAEACIDRLRELNPYVDVSAHTGSLQVGFLQQFTVIVMTASTPEDRERVNAFCREQSPPIKFIAAEAHGLSGFIFDDFGPEPGHLVTDATGERERSAFVGYIEKTNPCRVVFLQDFGYAFMSDDWVSFKEVRGMTQLNGIDASPIKIVDRYTIELTNVDATDFDDHTGGGIAFQVKQEVRVPMRSLAECNTDLASIMPHDWSKAIAPDQIHACFRGLHAFQAEHGGGLPELGVKAHEEAVASATAAFLESLGEGAPEVPDWLPRLVARQARVELSPVASILGGMAAQEVIKATGSKNLPINQFFYFNGFEALADGAAAAEAEPVQEADLPAAPFRSFGELICFGPEMVNSLANLRTFVVGAGALGCEFLKGFAMMGVAVGESGAVTVTDMDHIEISNLNRQFLFRSEHIGQSKATVAGGAAATLNPAIKVVTMEDRVGRDTENVFHDDFWRGQDVIVNALDNVKARLYVDSKCVEFHRPLLESGTLGTKSNVQVVIPSLTEAYGSSRDAPASEIPLCTLHNFPYLVEHCIQLSREQFETYFKKVAVDTVSWIEKGTDHLEAMKNEHERRTAIEAVADLIAFADGADFASCVNWARERFEALYNHHFRDMLVSFPADKLDSHGNPFWSGTKRLPHPLEFDIEDPLHYGFIEAGANLRAALIGIPPERDAAVIRGLIEAAPVPEYAPKHLKVQTDEKQKVSLASEEDGQVIARLVEETPRDVNAGAFVPAEFEKDDDSNFHIDYIYCAANLRARCYDIEEKERMDVKRIAGNIIPALATTTSMTTGLVLIELYKTVQGLPVEAFRNSFVNLALPLVTFSEPLPPPTFKSPGPEGQSFFPEGYSIWDKIEIAGGPDVTLQDVVDHFASTQNMELTMVSIGEALIYAGFMPGHASRPAQKLVDLYTTVAKKEIGSAQTRLQLDVECEDADGTEFSCAPVYVGIR